MNTWKSVREYKCPASRCRTQGLIPVVRLEDVVPPIKKVRVCVDKVLPALFATVAHHSFMNQEDIGPGDGLVIEVRFPVGVGEALQAGGEPGQCFQHWLAAQIEPHHPDVVWVMKVCA